MKTAPILRQMPVAPSSRLLGTAQQQQPPRPPAAFTSAPAAKAAPGNSVIPPGLAQAPSPLGEAEIEQRSLAMAQRMMKAEAEQLRKAAREEGLRAGREEGLRAAQAQVAEQLQAQQQRFLVVADALAAALARDREATEDAALELAMAALACILGQAPDAALVAGIVRQASTQLRDPAQVRIRLAPTDIELLKSAGIDPAMLVPQASDVQWIADATVEVGCVLQTAAGNLDARLHKQVSTLAEALLRTYRARGVQA